MDDAPQSDWRDPSSGIRPKPYNTLVIAPNRLFREGLKRLFDGSSFNVVVEMAEFVYLVHSLPAGLAIDLVLVEIEDEVGNILDLLQELRAALPDAKVAVLASRLAPGILQEVSLQVSALLSKDLSSSALFYALELVMLNEDVLSIALPFLNERKEPARPEPAPGEPAGFSARELEILRHMANGLSNKAIARKLDVAETTVKAYVKAILKKTKAENRTQAAVWCIANGLNTGEVPNGSEGRVHYRHGGRAQQAEPAIAHERAG